MYICTQCKKLRPTHESPTRVVVERREKTYPFRAKVNRVRRAEWKDDPGGSGWEIVKEGLMCAPCADKEHQSAEVLARFDS